jgi:hypothetical protein
MRKALVVFMFVFVVPVAMVAQEAYFVTYSHQMEEPGNLEVGNKSLGASPAGGNSFLASSMEFEYGVKGWWTSEFYLDAQSTSNESTLFSGFRWENRFRPLLREHWINPVLYTEFEDINSANKSLLEVVGNDGIGDVIGRNDRSEREREMELKLILSSNVKGWNISENFISEKNLAGEPWEFGYAVGVSRPLSLKASADACRFCRENLAAGLELYGGLGTTESFGLKDTSHYLAPVLHWQVPNGPNFKVSPGFGLNGNSMGFTMRVGVSYEIDQFVSRLRRK